MTTRHTGKILAGLAGLLLGQTGCANLPLLNSTSTTAPAPAAAQKDSLPPRQALQLSLNLADSLYQADDVPGAIQQYERVRQLDPSNALAPRRLAMLYDRAGEFDKAEAEYRKLAKAQPHDADLFNDWGRSYFLRNNWKEAEAKLRYALKLDSNHARARANLALALGQQERYQEAYQTFLEANLSEAEAHANMAFLFWNQGRLDQARQECAQASQLDPNCKKAHELLVLLDPNWRPIAVAGPGPAEARQARPQQPEAPPDAN